MRERFFARLLYGTLPLIVWTAHFFAVYLLVAAQCSPAAITPESPRSWMTGALSLLAIGACLGLLWRARSTLRRADSESSLLDWAAAGGAVLATTGIAWSSIPMLLLGGCG